MALWNSRLEVLNCRLAASNRAFSTASLPKARAVRKPDRLLSISWLMWPSFSLATLEARLIRCRMAMTTIRNTGIISATTTASRH